MEIGKLKPWELRVLWFSYAPVWWVPYLLLVRGLFIEDTGDALGTAFSDGPYVVHLYLSAVLFAVTLRLVWWERYRLQLKSGDLIKPIRLIVALTVGWIALFELLLFIF
jgi:hypothetical protein